MLLASSASQLAIFMIAVFRVAPDAVIWNVAGAPKIRRTKRPVRDVALLPCPPDHWSNPWCDGPDTAILQDDGSWGVQCRGIAQCVLSSPRGCVHGSILIANIVPPCDGRCTAFFFFEDSDNNINTAGDTTAHVTEGKKPTALLGCRLTLPGKNHRSTKTPAGTELSVRSMSTASENYTDRTKYCRTIAGLDTDMAHEQCEHRQVANVEQRPVQIQGITVGNTCLIDMKKHCAHRLVRFHTTSLDEPVSPLQTTPLGGPGGPQPDDTTPQEIRPLRSMSDIEARPDDAGPVSPMCFDRHQGCLHHRDNLRIQLRTPNICQHNATVLCVTSDCGQAHPTT